MPQRLALDRDPPDHEPTPKHNHIPEILITSRNPLGTALIATFLVSQRPMGDQTQTRIPDNEERLPIVTLRNPRATDGLLEPKEVLAFRIPEIAFLAGTGGLINAAEERLR